MKISQLIKLSSRLFFVKAKPEEFPESLSLLLTLLLLSFIAQSAVDALTLNVVSVFFTEEEFMELIVDHSAIKSMFMIIFGLFFTLAFMQLALAQFKFSRRLVQASISLLVVQIYLMVLSLVFFLLTYPVQNVAIEAYAVLWCMFLLASFIWSFRMFVYIFAQSFSSSIFHAVLGVLLYSILQGWLSQVVVNLVF